MPTLLTSHSYGKSRVRATRVTRLADRHEIRELTVDIRLEGDFDAAYTQGDNSGLIATDTMKNLVYALAQGRPAEAIEDFAAALAGHFLAEHAHVASAPSTLPSSPGSGSRSTAATTRTPSSAAAARLGRRSSPGAATASGSRQVSRDSRYSRRLARGSRASSATSTRPFPRPRTGSSPPRSRPAGSTRRRDVDFDDVHRRVRTALLETFATHDSRSVQQTLHLMGAAALAACAAIEEITLTLPNMHRTLVDLERFGRENLNEVFVATDEPFGLISGTLRRG